MKIKGSQIKKCVTNLREKKLSMKNILEHYIILEGDEREGKREVRGGRRKEGKGITWVGKYR